MENKTIINKAIKFIQKNPKANLSLQSIADNAGFSLTYFDAIFRQHTGYSPVEYSRVYKLTRSALELRKSEKSVLDIALDFGYASPESYTRAFKGLYSMTPSKYREKYSEKTITWHDLSGKIAINSFRREFPELKLADVDMALDYCFTHNPFKYFEDIIGMTAAESEILTLGDTDTLEHFIYVSDYGSEMPAVDLVCDNEADAILYLKLLSKNKAPVFTIHKSIECEWEEFDAEIEKFGLIGRYGFDMIYPHSEVKVPEYDGMSVRELCAEDMTLIKEFKQRGGCSECHVKAIQIHFDGKANEGMRPVGLFSNGEILCLAMPSLDQVRELRKYDIGAIFTIETIEKYKSDKAVELIWKYVIDMCLKDNAAIGNANARDVSTDPLGVKTSERMGLVKIAKNCGYSK